jgi:hypothetical protein
MTTSTTTVPRVTEATTARPRRRAEAMEIRDSKADQGGVNEEDWRRIDELLQQSWRSLHAAVNP